MQLIELRLENFRRFVEASFEFCPGMNLIWGPNESGKSTVHEAVCAALFGRERGQNLEHWDGGPCSAVLTYRNGDRTYRLSRGLSEASCSLGAVTAGGEPADVISDKDAVAAAVAEHLGISQRSVFDNTISVRQSEIGRLNNAGLAAIGNEIQRVVTGTERTSAGDALKKLKDRQKSIIGKARPAKPREYDEICARLQALAAEIAQVRGSRETIASLLTEQEALSRRIETDSERMASLSGLIERLRRWTDLSQRASELDKLHVEVFGSLKRIRELSAELKQVHKELEHYADLIGKVDEIADNLSKLESRRAELEGRLWDLQKADRDSPGMPGVRTALWLYGGALLGLAGVALGLSVDLRLLLLLIPSAGLVIRFAQLRAAGSAGDNRQLEQMAESARRDLNQVEAEQSNILSYMKCPNMTRAWARIKAYRALAARAHEYEITLKASLNSRTIEDWETQEAELARELSGVRRQIEEEFPDYSPTTEEAEGWRAEFQALQRRLPADEARLNQITGELEAENRNSRDLAALEGELEYVQGRKKDLEFLHKAYGEAISALEVVTQDVSTRYLPTLRERAAECLEAVTGGRYCEVNISADWQISVNCVERSGVSPSLLSAGTLDQLYFALRLACGELLSSGRPLPLILDDPFVNCDRERLDRILGMLAELSEKTQVLLMTHDPYILEWGRDLRAAGSTPCMVHELQASRAADGTDAPASS